MSDGTGSQYPLFDKYTLDTLMARLGYSGEYLLDVRSGRKPACGILRRKEAELLGD